MMKWNKDFAAECSSGRSYTHAQHHHDRVVVTMDNGNIHTLPVEQFARWVHRNRTGPADVVWAGVKGVAGFALWAGTVALFGLLMHLCGW